ncbi:hypothetical protein GGR56DRAFT_672379 [Xylariaceae sp. FL0804]|nr:hypothetical protein GGR56DRAFT_672379 [Xylariaceae sp. FL0804]
MYRCSLICVRLNCVWAVFEFLQSPDNISRLRAGFKHVYLPEAPERDKMIQKEIDSISAKCSILSEELEQRARAARDPAAYGKGRLDPESIIIGRLEDSIRLVYNVHPAASMDTGCKMLKYVADATANARLPVILDLEFVNETTDHGNMGCECGSRAYLIDLDHETLTAYGGGHEMKSVGNDFNDVGAPDALVPRFQCQFSFKELRLMTSDRWVGFVNAVATPKDG